jgi:alpha-galactosidase
LKIAFIGAGSVVFTKNLLTDTLSFPELYETTIALNDIDPERLETAGMMAR